MLKLSDANLGLPKLFTPSSFVKFILISFSFFLITSCSVPGMLDADNYGRNHTVYAVDFNPKDLNSFALYKMDEGNWDDMGKFKNNATAKFQISLEGDFLTVQANEKVMDVPTYQTWLNYARQELGYTEESEYDVFNTVEDGWIYEIDLKKFPLIEGDSHRLLMYERR
ncbi:hypothetical protein JM83_2806 [Gillisia sp. Hel_I_86]|uniref:hypothetical protein n=1 Tax=Gillisia sp. Hel_I_86 TaxID=1249981 RepID=UPI00119AB520|nr:hypothetical protein [Gillisia sp. Hel_I_86]TVZ27746.1 hypothetical protein JM83_2806 [Gillisia sp. Hel_I_86]